MVRMMQAHILASSTNIRSVKWGTGQRQTNNERTWRTSTTPASGARRVCAVIVSQPAACPVGVTASHSPPNSLTLWQVTTFLPSWA